MLEVIRDLGLEFQVIFNKLSAAEMSALPTELQLDLLNDFEVIPEDFEKHLVKNN